MKLKRTRFKKLKKRQKTNIKSLQTNKITVCFSLKKRKIERSKTKKFGRDVK